MRSLIRSILPLIIFLFSIHAYGQRWTAVDPALIELQGTRDIVPQKYITYNTDFTIVKDILWTAPRESDQPVSSSPTLLTVGLADGSTDVFRMIQYDMMEPELALKYPQIRTFRGESVSNSNRTIRADWTESGFRAAIKDDNGMTYIDPYQRNDIEHRIVYYRNDFQKNEPWICSVTEKGEDVDEHAGSRQGDCLFRTYRLAQAANGEYSNYFGATSSAQSGLVMSAVVTAINRVNQVYEADVAVRLILIANTNLLFYYNPSTDPYTNSNGGTMLGQNITTCDAVIGNGNYDIGHVFSTGGGGVAYLNAVCNNSLKAGGVTGSGSPVGDGFYIDYVAHEMGHQFGGDHTFNSVASNCGGGNRTASSAYEVGSGTTIQAYAGICGVDDVQPHSDAYFHARSIQQISAHITSTNCAAFLTLNNTPPVVTSVPDYSIPISTPFVLTAVATDPNSDPLTYCWEEYDLETTSTEPPASNDVDGPLFRSFMQTSSPLRYIPRLSDLTANVNYAWEVLPSVGRAMNFRMTVRDYHNIAGCTKEDNIVVTSVAAAGPFIVTSQNVATTWTESSNQTITWNVANTTAAPVSCANVDIRLSLDGGFTYPTVLSLNEPNDGSATVSIPIGTTTQGRVMVKASNNIFFDINNVNIVINVGAPNFTISLNPATVAECNDGTVQTSVQVGQILGFSNPVTLSLLNSPPGANISFSPTIVIPGNNSTLTISNLLPLSGTFTPTVRGTSTTGNKDVIFTINLLTTPTTTTLLNPTNNSTNELINPLLDWTAVLGASQYEYQISTVAAFINLVQTGTSVTDQFQITSPLQLNTVYYWRIRAINPCGTGSYSSVFSFTTNCFSTLSTNVPLTISASGTPTINSTLTISNALNITDINVVNLKGTHTWVDDLKFTLVAPNTTTQVLFWDRPCNGEDNFNINFDDEAANSNWPCPPTDGLTYKPNNALTAFDGLNSAGIWTLKVQDIANQDGGSLNGWGLKVCGVPACQLVVTLANGSGVGTLPAALSCANNGDSIKISAALTSQSIDIGANPLTIGKNIVIIAMGANTGITTSGNRIFEIPNTTSAAQINNLTLKSGISLTGAAINNSGGLTLKNVNILKNENVSGASLIQELPGGQLTMIGTCNVQ
ncbi:MAG TPA: zinc-dependent metalloprotease family protein [Saprospiraceae bacterium]|nr:zinc-dependent metalloprotease family protein [Saprospiraceae bacterium]